MKRKITSLEYDTATSENFDIPNNGKKSNGNNATTGIGTDSDIHQDIMSTAIENTLHWPASNSNGLVQNNKMDNIGPIKVCKTAQLTGNCFFSNLYFFSS